MDTTLPAYGAGPGCTDGQGMKSARDSPHLDRTLT